MVYRACKSAGFTLAEVLVGVALTGMITVSLYAGLSFGFAEVRILRENLRATQILTERMEVARLLNWDQVANLPGYIPTNFTAGFYPTAPTNSSGGGVTYTGTVSVTAAPISESYSNDLRMINIQVSWTSGNVRRQRQVRTFVSQYGLQKYVY
jgi:type II secretory pathway pseudopilin PulG